MKTDMILFFREEVGIENGKNGFTFFLTKDKRLTVDENGYASDKHNFISKQSFPLTNLATCFGFLVKPSCD